MKRIILYNVILLMGVVFPVYATLPSMQYKMDGHEDNWTAFHYVNTFQKIDSCFALSNDLVLGFKANQQGTGLIIWDIKGKQQVGAEKQIAITVGKEHFIFQMKAMNKNMLMNRIYSQDFKRLLQALSFGQIALVEYEKQSINMVDLSGLPTILSQFHRCVEQNHFDKK